MPDRANRDPFGRPIAPILLSLAIIAPGCSPDRGTPASEKPRANSRQLKHIEELQKKGASPTGSPRAAR